MSESTNNLTTKAAAVAIVGAGLVVIAAELIPAVLIGVTASLVPDFRKLFARTRCELVSSSEKLLPAAPEV